MYTPPLYIESTNTRKGIESRVSQKPVGARPSYANTREGIERGWPLDYTVPAVVQILIMELKGVLSRGPAAASRCVGNASNGIEGRLGESLFCTA